MLERVFSHENVHLKSLRSWAIRWPPPRPFGSKTDVRLRGARQNCLWYNFNIQRLQASEPGHSFMSQMISYNSTNPTVMKILYYFSHLCTLDPVPHFETNLEGIRIYLTKADKDMKTTSVHTPRSQHCFLEMHTCCSGGSTFHLQHNAYLLLIC